MRTELVGIMAALDVLVHDANTATIVTIINIFFIFLFISVYLLSCKNDAKNYNCV